MVEDLQREDEMPFPMNSDWGQVELQPIT